MNRKPLHEINRPRDLDGVIGQPKACAIVRGFLERELVGGHCFWISGASGTGKTTIARILAGSIADDFFVTEIVGRDVDRAFLDALQRDSKLHALGKGGRAWIINEAHGMNRAAIERLLDLCESLPTHCAIVFTTTWDGQETFLESQTDSTPLLSRCSLIKLTNQGLAQAFAPHLARIAQAAGLDGQPEAAYVKLMQRCRNNVRAAFQAIEAGEMKAD